MDFVNKNELQKTFNQIRGEVVELNDSENYPSITLEVGHENKRFVNLLCKKEQFKEICNETKVGGKVEIKFYPVSRNKNNRWYNSFNVLSVLNL